MHFVKNFTNYILFLFSEHCGIQSFAQAFGKACQTVDKGARAHTRHFQKSRKHRQTIQNTSIGTASSRADACMLAVFSGSEYPCTPIARRKRHRASFLASLPRRNVLTGIAKPPCKILHGKAILPYPTAELFCPFH